MAGVAVSCTSAGESFEPIPRTVVIRDRMGENDSILFYFPASESSFEERIARAAERASVPNRGIEERDTTVEGARLFALETTLGTKRSFLSRRLDGSQLAPFDVFGNGSLVVRLHPWATPVSPEVLPITSDPFSAEFSIRTGQTVGYRLPPSHLVEVLGFLLGIVLFPYVVLRWAAGRIRRSSAEDVDKVHRLRVATAVVAILVPIALIAGAVALALLWVPDVVLAGLAPSLTRDAALESILGLIVFVGVYLLAMVPAYRAIGPLYRQLRGIEASPVSRATRIRLAVGLGVPFLIWVVAINVVNLQGNALVGAISDVVLLVLLLALTPVVLIRALPTRSIAGPLRSRLDALLAERGVRVRDIRVWQTRSQKVGNALVLGAVPRFRYVILTDYLLDNLAEKELEAIVAHEMGHAKQHHVLLKLLGLVAVIAVVAGGSIALSVAFEGLSEALVAIALPLAFIVGALLVQGWLGLVLERKADDYGAELIGVEPMVGALERLGAMNMMKPRTGLLWDVLNQHPGLEQRIERLRRATERSA